MLDLQYDGATQKEVDMNVWAQMSLVETIVNASADYICAIDKDERFIIFNNNYQQLTGISKEAVIGKRLTEVFPHLDNSDIRSAMRKAWEGETTYFKKYHSTITHKYYENRIIPLKQDSGEVYGALLIAHDIDQRIRAEENLQKANEKIEKSEQQYQRMVNEIEDYAILLLSINGQVENWNRGAEKIKGYTASEILGSNFRVFYTKKDREDKLPERLLETARVTGKATHEGWRVRKDGSVFWGSITITALHNEKDEVIGFSKVTRDLTAQKIAQDQLKVSAERLAIKNKELERSNNELTSFSYVASHDLQEPLRKIKTFGKLILDRDGNNFSESGKDYFNRMINATDRMKGLMDALLEFSRVNTEKRELVMSDLNVLLEDVKRDLSELLESSKGTITSVNLPQLEVIPFQFKQLLYNLISNSIKYSRDGVPPLIDIRYQLLAADNIRDERAMHNTDYYCFTLQDNGIGFEPENAGKIFELFHRLHGKSEYSGSGIGLSICKKIAENHGGFITAEGKLGTGATFHIYIPAKEKPSVI